MTNNDSTKGFVRRLPEDDQDAIAEVALSQLKNRSRLEKIAEGSVLVKLGWILPIAVSVAILGAGRDLSGFLPIIIVALLFLIQGMAAHVHSRMDAIYRLMKDDKESLAARINQVEHCNRGDDDKTSD